jgi:hypothetical protein
MSIDDLTTDSDQVFAWRRVIRDTAGGDQGIGRFVIALTVRGGLILR